MNFTNSYKTYMIFIIILNLTAFSKQDTCKCPLKPDNTTMTIPSDSQIIKDEVIMNVNYGKPFNLNGKYILPKNFTINPLATRLIDPCPVGWRIPNLKDMNLLISNYSLSIYNNLMSSIPYLQDGDYIISSVKSFPEITSETDSKSYQYKAMFLENKTTGKMSIVDITTYSSLSLIKAVCVFDETLSPFIYNSYDYIINKEYSLSVVSNNNLNGKWKIDGRFYEGNEIKFKFESVGCKTIEVWSLNIEKSLSYDCKSVWASNLYGSLGSVDIDNTSFKSVEIDVKSSEINYIFFNGVNVATAPRQNGGFYVLYSSDTQDRSLRVSSFSNSFSLEKTFIIKENSFPLDIVATEWGFVVFGKNYNDNYYSWLSAYNSNGDVKWTRNIVNNGDRPTKYSDQVSFYNEKGEILSGLNAMFSTQNGKLAYGRGRISLIFAHYNYFGIKNGERDDHTGDTLFTFDENGENENYAWSWKTSHSLNQVQIYDGKYFITASLGDVYPENINVCFISPLKYTSKFDGERKTYVNIPSVCKEIVNKGKIPGNGRGNSCGRLGGLTKIRDKYYLTFTRQSCSIKGYDGKTTSDSNNDFALIEFTFDGVSIVNTNYYRLGDGSKIINIRSQKYGNSILILLAYTNNDQTGDFLPDRYSSGQQSQSILLVDVNGNIKKTITNISPFFVPVTQDIDELVNGEIVWGYINPDSKKINVAYLNAPSTKGEEYVMNVPTASKEMDSIDTGINSSYSYLLKVSFFFMMIVIVILDY